MPAPNHVQVCGNDHSPWVQAVLLGLREKGIRHTLVTVPPPSVIANSGVVMPVAQIDDGPWLLDSERILVALGFSKVEAAERRAMQSVFLSDAMRRTEGRWEFWRRFSFSRDGHPSAVRRMWNHFWRTFPVFYFFLLITFGSRGRSRPTEEQLVEEFRFFQDRLAGDAAFLGGAAPDTVDLQLFGQIQMFASIPGPSLRVLREHPELARLRGWIGAMQERFRDHPRLYSAPWFEPRLPEIEPARALERCFYWAGAVAMWIALPISLLAVVYYATRVRKKGLLRS